MDDKRVISLPSEEHLARLVAAKTYNDVINTTSTFTVKDSGKRQEYETGSRRDPIGNKPQFGLLPWYVLKRWADHMGKGAEKYGPHNWRKGQPLSRYFDSAVRHLYDWLEGKTDEDHLAAALFNVAGLMWTEAMIRMGKLPKELNDILGILEVPE